MQVETGRGEMENIVQIKAEKRAFQESELEKLIRMVTHQQRREAMAHQEGETSPLIHIVDLLIEEAIKMRASDIHTEPQEDEVLIRNRIDGLFKKHASSSQIPSGSPHLPDKNHGLYGHCRKKAPPGWPD